MCYAVYWQGSFDCCGIGFPADVVGDDKCKDEVGGRVGGADWWLAAGAVCDRNDGARAGLLAGEGPPSMHTLCALTMYIHHSAAPLNHPIQLALS